MLTQTEGAELDQLAAGVEDVLQQFYPESATWALDRYEKDLVDSDQSCQTGRSTKIRHHFQNGQRQSIRLYAQERRSSV